MGQNSLGSISSTPVIVEPDRCSGCGRCIAACPEKLYTLTVHGYRKQALNKAPRECSLCGRCLPACPLAIIR